MKPDLLVLVVFSASFAAICLRHFLPQPKARRIRIEEDDRRRRSDRTE